MKLTLTFCFSVLSICLFAQPLSNGATFFNEDSTHYYRFEDDQFEFFTLKNTLIYPQKFSEFPEPISHSFYKSKIGDKVVLLNPDTKYMLELDLRLNPYCDYYLLKAVESSLSGDTLFKLKPYLYMNLKGEVIVDREQYHELKNKNKKYVIKSDTDLFMDDYSTYDISPGDEQDETTTEMLLCFEMENKFLLTEEFDEWDYPYDGYDSYESGEKCNERFYIIKKNKKYGILTSMGRYILPAEFDNIEFTENEWEIENGDYFMIKGYKGKTCHVFDKRGKEQFQNNFLSMEAYPYAYETGGSHYFYGFEIRNKDKKGLIHSTGEQIVPPVYKEYDYFDFFDTEKIKRPNDLSLKANCEYYPYQNYFVGIKEDYKTRDFYAPSGQFLQSLQMDYLNDYNRFGHFSYELDGMMGLVGISACPLLKPEYNYIEIFKGNRPIFLATNTNDETCFIDGQGQKLFGQFFSYAQFADTSYAVVYSPVEKAVGLMDVLKSQQNIVWKFKPEFDHIEGLDLQNRYYDNSNYHYFVTRKNGVTGVLDSAGRMVLPYEYQSVNIKDNYIQTKKDGKFGLRNKLFATVFENEYDSIAVINGKSFLLQKNGKWAVYDLNNIQKKTGFDFDQVQLKYTYPQAFIVRKNGKYGVLTYNLEWFIEPKYEEITFDYISKEFECLKENKQKDCYWDAEK